MLFSVNFYKFNIKPLNVINLIFLVILILINAFCKTKEVKAPETPVVEPKAYLGIIYVETSTGVQIAEVFPNSPAQKAGLEPGDLILTANGYPILGTYTLKEHIFSLKSGSEVILEVEKLNGKRIITKAILEPLPEEYKKFYKNNIK